MSRKRKYTEEEIIRILYASEGRASPVSQAPGHTISLHIDIPSVNDRLVNVVVGLEPGDTRRLPIIMAPDSGGRMASALLHRQIWRELNPGMNAQEAKRLFNMRINNHKKAAGAFWDLPQAAKVAAILLNSPEGQVALEKLDLGSEERVSIELSLPTGSEYVWKMRYGQHGDAGAQAVGSEGRDQLYNFSKGFILVDKLTSGGIHIQTLFPLM